MSKRVVLLALLVFFGLGNSFAFAQQENKQDDWEKAVQIADQVQLLILRFAPLLLAIAAVAICTSLLAIKSAVVALTASVVQSGVNITTAIGRTRNGSS
jgi:hypothetical protein